MRPACTGNGGINRAIPHLGGGEGIHKRGRTDTLLQWFEDLSDRLRNVRVCCGDWSRICGPSPTIHNGLTAVYLDPPYADTADRDADVYNVDSLTVAHDVRKWAIENGDNPLLRIALSGYESEHEMPDNWSVMSWKAVGGYGNQGKNEDDEENRGKMNAHRERVWFSPHCLSGKTGLGIF